ncbi:hypothetical protein BD626DRAFT_391472 [Schizophyllum amplum]|uniref:MYND-type domain-containing protein n=1 Tax=Schizophyllum amplum TaxID=97359 RepID=A0A550D0H9_9AGAR|nr:hypothetical protein BD626DRAFT_391472 [Auriculariopsis ampla]
MQVPKPGEALPTDPKTIRDVKKRLRTPSITFKHLCVDPFTLEDHHWDLSSREVLGAVRELDSLNSTLELHLNPDANNEALGDVFHACVRTLWPTLLLWLDFLHPRHHKGTERIERVPLQTLSNVMHAFCRAEGPTAVLRAHTSPFYRLLYLLWLRFDEYCTKSTDVARCLDKLGRAVRLTVDVAAAEQVAGPVAQSSTSIAPSFPHCLPSALYAARNRPRQLYRQALTQVNALLKFFVAFPHDTTPYDALQTQIGAIGQFANAVLPLNVHARDVIRSLVHILRVLCSFPAGYYLCGGVVYALHVMWRTCSDGRSIAWALDEGVLPLMIELRQKELEASDKKTIADALRVLAENTYRRRVLRALCSGGRTGSFHGAGFASQDTLLAIDKWVQHRNDLMRRAYSKACALPKCGAEPNATLKKCPCLSVCYCSAECQRADWKKHKKHCKIERDAMAYTRILSATDLEKMPFEEAHFICLCARDYVSTHAQAVVESVKQAIANSPPTRDAPVITIMINAARLLGTHRVYVDEQRSQDSTSDGISRRGALRFKDPTLVLREPSILVIAHQEDMILHAMGTTLQGLEDLALVARQARSRRK